MPRRHAGFTLIELVIGLMILGLLAGMALPSFRAWIQNSQIRTGAESVLNGLQVARAEAVRRNLLVEFQVGAGSSWTVSIPTTGEVVQTRSGADGSAKAAVVPQPGGATIVTFNGMGWVAANDDGSPTMTRVDVTSSVLTGSEARPLRVVVTPGGAAKMCDPQVAAGDPRVCP
jgi:type IV fimbrial biogenesis protein FimT